MRIMLLIRDSGNSSPLFSMSRDVHVTGANGAKFWTYPIQSSIQMWLADAVAGFFTPWWQIHDNLRDGRRNIVWSNDPDRTQMAFELLSITPTEGAHGLQLINLTKCIGSLNVDPRMITRTRSRQIYDAVCAHIMSGDTTRALVEGSPGSGKSRNLLYMLKQFMQANQLILYEDSASGTTFAFVPEQRILHYKRDTANPRPLDGLAQDPHRYTVVSTRSITEHVKCAAAGMRKTVYLFDPSTSATEPPQFACRMVISSRPDAKHFAAFVKHNHNVHRYKLNTYTLEEAVEFYELLRHPTNESYAPNVQKFLSDDQIRDGYADVGGCVRALASEEHLRKAKRYQRFVIDGLKSAQVDRLLDIKRNPIELLALDKAGVDTFLSEMLCYHNDADPSNYNTHAKHTVTHPVAETIMLRIVAKRYTELYERMEGELCDRYGDRESARTLLEYLGTLALTVGGEFLVKCLTVPRTWNRSRPSYTLRLPRAASHSTVPDLITQWAALLMCPTEQVAQFIPVITPDAAAAVDDMPLHTVPAQVVNPVPVVSGGTGRDAPPIEHYPERHLLLSGVDNNPVVDVADHRNRGFKFTTKITCPIALQAINEQTQALGSTSENPLHLFFVVPEYTYRNFNDCQEIVNKAADADVDADRITRANLHNCVVQWVLMLPQNLPGAKEFAY